MVFDESSEIDSTRYGEGKTMRIENKSFEVFEREDFIYRVGGEDSKKVKGDYSSAWNEWKEIVNMSVKDSKCEALSVESTEMWQNSGNLSKRFWTRIKDGRLLESRSCIAAMISKDNLRVYLEWHAYKDKNLHDMRKIHNEWIFLIEEWIKEKSIDATEYKVWTNKDEDEQFLNYHTLAEFINDKSVKENLLEVLNSDNKNWIRVGNVFKKETVINQEDMTEVMGLTIRELEWIYKKVAVKAIKLDEKEERNAVPIQNETPGEIKEHSYTFLSNKDLITHIHSYITAKGFFYTREEVTNLFLSLKTKPFVILSGISGTGKTKIVQWFAESVGATEENGQFTLIPIRPDWNDGSDLLGYVDIKGDFKQGPFTRVIEKAEQNPDDPYFVLLDEMNLARVEHYFSDVLSVMESRKWEAGEMVTSTLLSAEVAQRDIRLPVNLYVIGTVNMDETTHPFSKKVLDRANTIEFNRVALSNLSFLEDEEEVEPKLVQDHMFRSKYLHLKDLYLGNQDLVQKVTAELEEINKSLILTNAHIGYRVRDEICFYLAYNEESDLMDFNTAFDHCILQKILPRISGSDSRVDRLLRGLYQLFTTKEYSDDPAWNESGTARYPKSAAKVVEMLGRLEEDGFTSYWIS